VNPDSELATAELTIDTPNYEGGEAINFYIKYFTWYNNDTPLYYLVSLENLCASHTIAAINDNPYTLKAIKQSTGFVISSTKP
jgi:hypothetical protein